MKFTKMHGLGNDYVYVDCFRETLPAEPAELAVRVADRHFGIGGDGLILITPSERADARMRMFNADGSESEMCGNGVRCVAKYVYDHGISKNNPLRIETGAGVLTLELNANASDRVERVRVDMGEPILPAAKVPVAWSNAASEQPLVDVPWAGVLPTGNDSSWIERCGAQPGVTAVSMGNPHVVCFVADVNAIPLETIGPLWETAAVFPRRINVHFVQVHSPNEVTMRTWERGSGITLACGTGASAVCVAGALAGKTSRNILAHLPGGNLELEWNEANNHVYMTGPAVEVFSGEWIANSQS